MKHHLGPFDVWANLVREIITCRSRQALLRVTVLVLACTPAAVAVAIILLLR
jgi:hypothetical protein